MIKIFCNIIIGEKIKFSEINDIQFNYNNEIISLQTVKSSTIFFIFCTIISFSIIGLVFWNFYVSNNTAIKNLELQEKIKNDLVKLKEEYQEINWNNKKIISLNNQKILNIENKIKSIMKEYSLVLNKDYYNNTEYEDDYFKNIRIDSNKKYNEKIKGVYIIWNKTKNKYYIGQSKDVYKRLFRDHFLNGDVKNIIFARDWYNKDTFFYKIIECYTKDELDDLEKEYIEKYNAFENGYNKTRGND